MIKFLADVNIERPIVEFLKNSGYDITWIPDYDPSMPDDELLNMAIKEKRILLTNDKDFGYFIFLQKKRLNGIILFRIKGQKIEDKLNNLRELLDRHDDKIDKYFIVITEKKIRFTPLR